LYVHHGICCMFVTLNLTRCDILVASGSLFLRLSCLGCNAPYSVVPPNWNPLGPLPELRRSKSFSISLNAPLCTCGLSLARLCTQTYMHARTPPPPTHTHIDASTNRDFTGRGKGGGSGETDREGGRVSHGVCKGNDLPSTSNGSIQWFDESSASSCVMNCVPIHAQACTSLPWIYEACYRCFLSCSGLLGRRKLQYDRTYKLCKPKKLR
jgi:hypothetical protein